MEFLLNEQISSKLRCIFCCETIFAPEFSFDDTYEENWVYSLVVTFLEKVSLRLPFMSKKIILLILDELLLLILMCVFAIAVFFCF